MLSWTNNPATDKTYVNACAYFKLLIKQHRNYKANSNGTAVANGFGSINNATKFGNELCKALKEAFNMRENSSGKECDKHMLPMNSAEQGMATLRAANA